MEDSTNDISERWKKVRRRYQQLMDVSVPHPELRWSGAGFLLLLYICRVVFVGGFYLVTYVVSIRQLFVMVDMITPSVPIDTPLPTSSSKEHEAVPFVAKRQEFVVWKSSCWTLLCGLIATFFPFLDIPLYWPILVGYVIFLSVVHVGREVQKMIRYKYVPWNTGKKKFVKRDDASTI